MPQCEKCACEIEPGEEREHTGRVLCEDCYMDALSPAKTCDPWATYTASRLPEQVLNPNQERIMAVIRQRGQVPPDELAREAGLGEAEFQREFAALRHMEKVRAALTPDGGKVIRDFHDRD